MLAVQALKRNTAMITSAGLSLPDQSSSFFEAQLGALDRPNQLPAPKALQSQSTHTKTSHFAKSQVQCRLSMQQPHPADKVHRTTELTKL